ncbi:hypothetical protein G6F68_012411 [Rhizopus microsporus]|nr:hypothetical protein G6F68_012411 [Rhizopus microsporus]
MPTLAPTFNVVSPRRSGSANEAISLRATWPASSGSARSRSTTMNSSPLKRPNRSLLRRFWCSRVAAAFSSASPVIASTSAPCASASARAASSSCCGPMSSVGVLTQSRTRRLAAPAQLQQRLFGGRQFAGQLPHAAFRQGVRSVRVAVGVGAITDADHRTGQAVGAGQQRSAEGAGSKALRCQPGLGGGRLAVLPGRELLAVQHVQRQRRGGVGGETSDLAHARPGR